MPKMRPISDVAKKWSTVTPQRAGEYSDGIQNPRDSWSAQTQAAAPNYAAGVNAAISANRFGKGVARAGDATWQRNALAKGPGRFSEGVTLGQGDYEEGFAPFAQVITSTTLPPRRAKGDPSNIQRVATMAAAMRAKAVNR